MGTGGVGGFARLKAVCVGGWGGVGGGLMGWQEFQIDVLVQR